MIYPNFERAIYKVSEMVQHTSHEVHTEKWQSMDISKRPEAAMRECLNVYFQVQVPSTVGVLAEQIKPNLPWADQHFELERVSGQPINPGTTWKDWPYALSADKFRREGEKFSHSYAERLWPKFANDYDAGGADGLEGIRYPYGDLMDVVNLLAKEPLTRQAYVPLWFPEDTGVVHGERVPCTLGYHFIRRNGFFHCAYFIRSCDFVRHFRDDLYLTTRLQLWMLEQLRVKSADDWREVKPGLFTIWIGSLHLFVNDYRKLFGDGV